MIIFYTHCTAIITLYLIINVYLLTTAPQNADFRSLISGVY